MSDLYLRVRAILWWLLPLAALVTLVAFETDLGRGLRLQAPPAAPVAAKPVGVSLLPEYTIDGGIASHSETVNRPLFVPTRRPAPVPVVEVAKPRMQRGQYALTGTTVAGERSLAFLKEVNGGKSRTVKMGDTINGLLVAEVKPDRVRLTFGDEAEELVLRVAANPKMTPQPAMAAASPAVHPPGAPQQQQPVVANQQLEATTESLAERRRAARAAQAAASAAEASAQAQAQGQPPPVQDSASQPPPAGGTVQQPDTGWAAIYQRYQQRRN